MPARSGRFRTHWWFSASRNRGRLNLSPRQIKALSFGTKHALFLVGGDVMKTKLLVLMLLAGTSLFARTHVSLESASVVMDIRHTVTGIMPPLHLLPS